MLIANDTQFSVIRSYWSGKVLHASYAIPSLAKQNRKVSCPNTSYTRMYVNAYTGTQMPCSLIP